MTIIGAPRDYFIAAMFPKWMVFAPGIAPILADGATYFGIVVLGHAVMRLIAGPAREDRLARHPSRLLKKAKSATESQSHGEKADQN